MRRKWPAKFKMSEGEDKGSSTIVSMQSEPAAEALVTLKDSVMKRSVDQQQLQQSPRKRGRENFKSPKKLQASHSKEPSTDVSEGSLEAHDSKRYNLRVAPSPTGLDSPSKARSRHRKSTAPKVLMIGNSLRNFLKLQKAHQWCYYEWFYSDIDKPFFEGENDFCQYLQELFPTLKTRQLRRSEWHQLRRLMGKPRRCSASFFNEERQLLQHRRNKVRNIQQGLATDFSDYRDLPDNIPQSLVVGTRVIAWLRQSGLSSCYSGQVEAVEYNSNEYLISFDRPGLGKHHIADIEVKSMEELQTFSISELEVEQQKQWEVRTSSSGIRMSPKAILPSPFKNYLPHPAEELMGDLDHTLVRTPSLAYEDTERMENIKLLSYWSRLLSEKKVQVSKLQHLNTQVEKMGSRGEGITMDVQRQFAQVIVDLDDVNKQLNSKQEAFKKITFDGCKPGSAFEDMSTNPSDVYGKAAMSVVENLCQREGIKVESQNSLSLITKMSSVLLQIEAVTCEEPKLDLSSLSSSIQALGLSVSSKNYEVFQRVVETPLRYIQAGLNPADNLHPLIVGEGDHPPFN